MEFVIKKLAILIPYLKNHISRYLAGSVMLLLTNAFAVAIPYIMKLAVDSIERPAKSLHSVEFYAASIILLAIFHLITRIYSRTLILNAARIIEYDIRNSMFDKLLTLDQNYFGKVRTGDILSRFANDLTNVRMLAGFGAMSGVNTLIIYTAALILMFRIDFWLTILSILPFPIMIFVVKKISNRLFQRSLEAQENLAKVSNVVEESVSSIRIVKLYAQEENFYKIFKNASDKYLESNLKISLLRGFIIPIMALGTGAGSLMLLYFGGRLVISSSISLGDFVAFAGYLSMLVWPTAVMGWILTLMQRGAASTERISELISVNPEVREAENSVEIATLQDSILFKDFSFSYNSTPLLKNITLEIKKGEKIGIAGSVGCGKSTIAKAVAHLLPINDSTLFFDGIDVNHIKLKSHRNLIGYVPQEPFLFSRSIKENIGYPLDEIDEELTAHIAAQARLENDIAKFSDRLDTVVGEKGVMISGGQRQRISIARAIARDPSILILDDPLSAVDAEKEEEILKELRLFYRDRTVIIISHRFSAFKDCDRVILLKDGVIAENGKPSELIEQGGLYAEMYAIQQMKRELD